MAEISSVRFLTPLRWASLLGVGLLILGGSAWVAVRLGPRYDGNAERSADVPASVFWSIRVPRVWAAVVVGWALGVAGALYQGMLQNPLADPYLLGVSGGAALGVTLAVPWDWPVSIAGVSLLMVAAFAGALAFTFLVYRLARIRDQLPVYSLILAGVVLNAIAAAFILLVTVTREYFQVQRVALWLIGQIQPLAYPFLIVATVWVLVWTLAAWRDAPYLNLLLLGEDIP
ncbi:MAG: iron ABC transporter permease, partial [Acidobacteria bacterium]|nr:iron ABC transporter permease [Acidobacteriota bacterium]MDW7985553.1 iron chelate uptake ABC transporter family permease subunit [Acidobacteriota bacterium]